MNEKVSPAGAFAGEIRVPGDKSISHRYALLAGIAEGRSRIRNFSSGADCRSTLGAVAALGVAVVREGNSVTVEGRGLDGLRAPVDTVDAGNSGSTMRMLAGILAAQPFVSRLAGDESLSRRPMGRVMEPLTRMGARIEAREGRFPPLTIHGGPLRPIDYTPPVASAQVKTCVLLAGLFASGETTLREAIRTRDHTELALREFGADLEVRRDAITVRGRARLRGRDLAVPGDLSAAAFFLVAAMLVPGSRLEIRGVGLNPTRTALLDFLAAGGARLRVVNVASAAGELYGDVVVEAGPFRGGVIEKATTAALIDEIPVLAVLGAASESGLTVRDAAELRVKETDRIAAVAENLGRMGVAVETRPDGFTVPGRQRLRGAAIDSFGDHRIAMAFAVAGLAADGETTIEGAEAAAVSYPEFFATLRQLAG